MRSTAPRLSSRRRGGYVCCSGAGRARCGRGLGASHRGRVMDDERWKSTRYQKDTSINPGTQGTPSTFRVRILVLPCVLPAAAVAKRPLHP